LNNIEMILTAQFLGFYFWLWLVSALYNVVMQLTIDNWLGQHDECKATTDLQ
jgi:hypothetical protein